MSVFRYILFFLGILLAGGGALLFLGSYTSGKKYCQGGFFRGGSVKVEPVIYRHHRLFGGAVVLLSLLSLLTFHREHPDFLPYSACLEAAMTVALGIGLGIAFRPSILKPLERVLNHWVVVRIPQGGTDGPFLSAVLFLVGLFALIVSVTGWSIIFPPFGGR